MMTIYPIVDLYDGRVAIAPCPMVASSSKSNELLDSEIESLKHRGYTLVVSMLTYEEHVKHGLLDEGTLCGRHQIAFMNYPIRDDIADSDEVTINFVNEVANKLQQLDKSEKVLFHCRGGVGRSSMMLTLVMAKLGYEVNDVFAKISHARGEQAPESEAQLQWVQKLSSL